MSRLKKLVKSLTPTSKQSLDIMPLEQTARNANAALQTSINEYSSSLTEFYTALDSFNDQLSKQSDNDISQRYVESKENINNFKREITKNLPQKDNPNKEQLNLYHAALKGYHKILKKIYNNENAVDEDSEVETNTSFINDTGDLDLSQTNDKLSSTLNVRSESQDADQPRGGSRKRQRKASRRRPRKSSKKRKGRKTRRR
jgi:hypothetical protein